MLTTDWIRAAVEGKTADGREILAQQLVQMAGSYNVETYAAKIWLEHLRGVLPDGVLKPLGTVAEVKAELISGGDLNGKMALYVKLEPTPELIAMVRAGQKTHLSMEMHPNFPTTGGAYLMGLGVTDSPASIGTGIMQFSTNTRPDNLFTSPLVCELGNCNDTTDDLTAIRAMLEKLTTRSDASKATQTPPVDPHKFAQQSDLEKLKADHENLLQRFEKFMSEDIGINRPPAAGGAQPSIGY